MFPQSFLIFLNEVAQVIIKSIMLKVLPCYYITKLTKYVLLRVKIKMTKDFSIIFAEAQRIDVLT